MKDVISVDSLIEQLDEDLSNQPGITTEIGWKRWGEEKQEYYQALKTSLYSLLISKLLEKREAKAPYDILELEKAFQNGRSSAKDDMHRVIDEMFGVGDE